MKIHLEIIGALLVLLGLLHSIFPRYFQWKKELAPLQLINKQMMLVHTFFIALTVIMMGVLCLFWADELLHTKLGNILSRGLFIFWFIRLIVQFFVYDKSLWLGKRFETIVHIVFTLLWIYLSSVFFITGNFSL